MFRPNEENFLQMLFSQKEVLSEPYCVDGVIYIWRDYRIDKYVYLMSPSTSAQYNAFLEKVKEERPLLLELV